MSTTRRDFLSSTSLSTIGLVAAAPSIGSLIPDKAKASIPAAFKISATKQDELEDFVYDIENGSTGWTFRRH
jgi:oxalate decarboxylase